MESLFRLLNLLVMPFWLMMILAPKWRWTRRVAGSVAMVVAPCVAYVFLLLPQVRQVLPVVATPDLDRVAVLLSVPAAAIVGWTHFLAFDLFVGRWIFLEATERRMPSWLTSPTLVLTLLFGPMGLLLFLAIRFRWMNNAWTPSACAGSPKTSEATYHDPVRPTGIRVALKANPPLALTVWFNLGLMVVSFLGMAVDHRMVTGMPVWDKPLKFGISTAIYAATLAWLFTFLPDRERFVRWASWVASALLMYEVSAITMQAARGTTSHFNVSTPFDTIVYGSMGVGIMAVTAIQMAAVILLMRRRDLTDSFTLSLRMGAAITLLGMLAAIPMAFPRPDQIARHVGIVGGHAVGGPDGGAGLAVLGWSVRHGDLRIAHFWGLHGMQVLPVLALLLERFAGALPEVVRTRLIRIAASAYTAVLMLLLTQALRGEPLAQPGRMTISLAAAIALVTAIASAVTIKGGARRESARHDCGDPPRDQSTLRITAGHRHKGKRSDPLPSDQPLAEPAGKPRRTSQ